MADAANPYRAPRAALAAVPEPPSSWKSFLSAFVSGLAILVLTIYAVLFLVSLVVIASLAVD